MTENYITLSLETHLFFSRIMKEHALFLEAGFPCKNNDWIQKADYFRKQFERLLMDVVKISDGRINNPILDSEELVTDFTIDAENRTQHLSGISINSGITKMQRNLNSGSYCENNRDLLNMVHHINQRSIHLLNALIDFKESILKEVDEGRLFNANYPLLIKHITREACLYRSTIENLMSNKQVSYQGLFGTEEFWNQIMMEHALFIRGLLDPSEEELIIAADDFVLDYSKLLEMARNQDCKARELSAESLAKTLEYQEFKTAGTKGILGCDISSLILPLLADHVLREANHYIRILQCAHMKENY